MLDEISDQGAGTDKKEHYDTYGGTAPQAQSPAKWEAHGHCLDTQTPHELQLPFPKA